MKKYPWVTNFNYGRSNGAWARFSYKGIRHEKYFTGPDKLIRAYEWVLKKKTELGQSLLRNRFRSIYRGQKRNGLPVGVAIVLYKKKYFYAQAHASIVPYSQIRKRFSINKLGRKKAIQLAVQCRKKWVMELINSGSHGKTKREFLESTRQSNNDLIKTK